MSDEDRLLATIAATGTSRADTLIAAAGIGSQPTFSRLIARLGERVVAIGKARARRYAAARTLAGLGPSIPVFSIGPAGDTERIARLRPFGDRGVYLDDPATMPEWLRGPDGDGTFDGLPPAIADACPAGYLGPAFARRSAAPGLAERLDDWSADDWIVALARTGEDLPGVLRLGEASARAWTAACRSPAEAIAPDVRGARYATLAEIAGSGAWTGPWIRGDSPRFAATTLEGGTAVEVSVEFSPSDYSEEARRACDLLVCAHLAAQALRDHGLPTPATRIVEGGSRVFLQRARSDRDPARGRRLIVSLGALEPSPGGNGAARRGWSAAAEGLATRRIVGSEVVARLRFAELFARFLAHRTAPLTGIVLLARDDGRLDLHSIDEFGPSAYAPDAEAPVDGELEPPSSDPGETAAWREAGELARRCWAGVAADERVSASFRAIAAGNAAAVDRALARFADA